MLFSYLLSEQSLKIFTARLRRKTIIYFIQMDLSFAVYYKEVEWQGVRTKLFYFSVFVNLQI